MTKVKTTLFERPIFAVGHRCDDGKYALHDYISRTSPENAIARHLFSWDSRYILAKDYSTFYTWSGYVREFPGRCVMQIDPKTGEAIVLPNSSINDSKVETLVLLKKRVQRPATKRSMTLTKVLVKLNIRVRRYLEHLFDRVGGGA